MFVAHLEGTLVAPEVTATGRAPTLDNVLGVVLSPDMIRAKTAKIRLA
jgi:hypothetical protein